MNVTATSQETIKGTTKDFEKMFGVERTVVTGLIKFLAAKGLAKEAGKQAPAGGKGMPSIVWEVNTSVAIKFAAELEAVA